MAYSPGDFWRICQRCGFKCRQSNTAKEWTGLIVCMACFEPRHPQDFVRGRKDIQTVPDPRPEPVDAFLGTLQTALTADASAGATSVFVESSARWTANDAFGVMLANGNLHRGTVSSVLSATSLNFDSNSALPSAARSGALIVNYSAIAQPDIG